MDICILILFLGIIVGIIYYLYKQYETKDKYHYIRSTSSKIDDISNKKPIIIENEEDFISLISSKYKTYEDFLVSKDFDDYFTYWDTHENALSKLKELIEKNKSTLHYKNIKFKK